MPDVTDATLVEEALESNPALSQSILRRGASTIKSYIENSIKISHQDSGDRRINFRVNFIKKIIPRRVTIRSVQTTDSENFVAK